MINYESVKIDFAAAGNSEIYQNLKILYTTPEGTVPFDRNFGINIAFIDNPLPIAQGKMIIEYVEKTKRYEPRSIVEEVLFDYDVQTGKVIPKVVIAIDTEIE